MFVCACYDLGTTDGVGSDVTIDMCPNQFARLDGFRCVNQMGWEGQALGKAFITKGVLFVDCDELLFECRLTFTPISAGM